MLCILYFYAIAFDYQTFLFQLLRDKSNNSGISTSLYYYSNSI